MLLGVLGAASASAGEVEIPWAGLNADSAVALSEVRQEVLPKLTARAVAAAARQGELQALLDGERTLRAAFPMLEARDFGSMTVLSARGHELDERGVARETARRAEVPRLSSRRWTDALARAWTSTLAAEESADLLERRVLFALRGGLVARPSLTTRAVEMARASLEVAFAAASAVDEPGPVELAAAAVLQEDRQRWTELVDRLRTRLVVPSVPVPDPSAEIEALSTDSRSRGEDALARLAVLRPWLTPQELARSEAAEASWLDRVARAAGLQELADAEAALAGVSAAGLPESADDLALEVASATGAVVAAQARFESLPDGPEGSPTHLRKALADLDVRVVDTWRDVGLARQAAHKDATEGQLAAEAARKAAAEAATADGAQASPRAALSELKADSLSWRADADAAVAGWVDGLQRGQQEQTVRLSELRAQVETLLAGDTIDSTADAILAKLRGELGRLRKAIDEGPPHPGPLEELVRPPAEPRRVRLEALSARVAEIEAPEERGELETLATEASAALASETAPGDRVQSFSEEHFRTSLLNLRTTKALRHDVLPLVSTKARQDDNARFIEDLRAEVRLLRPQLGTLLTDRLQLASKIGDVLLDFNQLTAALSGGMYTLGLLVLWGWVRRRRERVADWLLEVRGRWVPDEASAIRRKGQQLAIAAVLRPLADCVLAWFVYSDAREVLPELGIVVGAFATWSVFRLVRALTELVIAPEDQPRASPIIVSPESHALLAGSFLVLGTWWIAGWAVDRALAELVYADAIARVVQSLWIGGGVIVVLMLLFRWEKRLEGRVRRGGGHPAWLTRWLDLPGGRVYAPARALVLAAFLAAWAAWEIAQGRVASGESFNALSSMMDRVRFAGEMPAEGQPISAETYQAIMKLDGSPELRVQRTEASKALTGHFAEWVQDPRRGVMLMTGDRGDGKAPFLKRMMPMLMVEGHQARSVYITERMTTRPQALKWFADYFALDSVPEDIDGLCAAVRELPGQAHIIEDFQLCFLREVGGFGALRTFLYVCNATSSRHFWVLSIHRPAWAYLSRLGPILNAGVVRAVVDLAPLTASELRDLVERRTERAELEVDFRRLENTGPFGANPEIEHERAVTSFFRLLADASGGSPLVGLHIWAKSLRRQEDGKADVVVTPELAAGVVEKLDAMDLFVLAALRTQDRLTLGEVVAVTNAPLDDVRFAVRELVHRGIVHESDRGFRIDDTQLKAVTRTLRRRHYLQWEV